MIIAALYAAFQLTPSSYARALYMIGVTDTGLLFGFPQEERSDEWALWTPYLQIAVNNGFARIEHISPYEADLRNFNCLPLWDWGLIFKPQMWAFFVMPPAPAFSLMFAILFAACLIGYYLLARELRFSGFAAAIFALSMFSLQYVQLWWTTTGPLIAFFPWVLLACLTPMPAWLRIPVLVWITGTFLLAEFYVITIASLVFAGGFALVALRPDVLRVPHVLTCLAGGAIGFGLAVLYLWGPFQIMADTVYPGHRDECPRRDRAVVVDARLSVPALRHLEMGIVLLEQSGDRDRRLLRAAVRTDLRQLSPPARRDRRAHRRGPRDPLGARGAWLPES